MTYQQISDQVGLPKRLVQTIVQRAIKKLGRKRWLVIEMLRDWDQIQRAQSPAARCEDA